MLLNLMKMVKIVSKSHINMKSKIKFYSDLKMKKELACRIMVKWRFKNLKYGRLGLKNKIKSRIRFSFVLSTQAIHYSMQNKSGMIYNKMKNCLKVFFINVIWMLMVK